jgi:hypothetical protein
VRKTKQKSNKIIKKTKGLFSEKKKKELEISLETEEEMKDKKNDLKVSNLSPLNIPLLKQKSESSPKPRAFASKMPSLKSTTHSSLTINKQITFQQNQNHQHSEEFIEDSGIHLI